MTPPPPPHTPPHPPPEGHGSNVRTKFHKRSAQRGPMPAQPIPDARSTRRAYGSRPGFAILPMSDGESHGWQWRRVTQARGISPSARTALPMRDGAKAPSHHAGAKKL